MPQTYALIINWDNGPDTIACIRSVVSFDDMNILLLDNASQDDSVASIQRYLDDNQIACSTLPLAEFDQLDDVVPAKVLVVRSDANLGFARGNNVLLRYVLRCGNAEYAWLLNNDAVADRNALKEMIKEMNADDRTAFVGSVILDFTKTNIIQCCGVKYYKYFGVSKLILKDADWNSLDKKDIPFSEIDFQHGASLLVRVAALHDIGVMDERYFLYFEEHDWQHLAGEKGYNNKLAAGSIIYHKGSVSTSNKKHLFFYYYNRSAILFARKHSSLFICIIATFMLIGITLVRSKLYYKSVVWGMKGLIGAWKNK